MFQKGPRGLLEFSKIPELAHGFLLSRVFLLFQDEWWSTQLQSGELDPKGVEKAHSQAICSSLNTRQWHDGTQSHVWSGGNWWIQLGLALFWSKWLWICSTDNFQKETILKGWILWESGPMSLQMPPGTPGGSLEVNYNRLSLLCNSLGKNSGFSLGFFGSF